jgi:hypothetical protein
LHPHGTSASYGNRTTPTYGGRPSPSNTGSASCSEDPGDEEEQASDFQNRPVLQLKKLDVAALLAGSLNRAPTKESTTPEEVSFSAGRPPRPSAASGTDEAGTEASSTAANVGGGDAEVGAGAGTQEVSVKRNSLSRLPTVKSIGNDPDDATMDAALAEFTATLPESQGATASRHIETVSIQTTDAKSGHGEPQQQHVQGGQENAAVDAVSEESSGSIEPEPEPEPPEPLDDPRDESDSDNDVD